MAGNDQLFGGDGNDRLNGGAGNDSLLGRQRQRRADRHRQRHGRLRRRAAPAATSSGWTGSGSSARTTGSPVPPSGDKVQYVDRFANGADRTLDGDRIADPAAEGGAAPTRRSRATRCSRPPGRRRPTSARAALGDCWLLAGLAAIANDNPFALRQNVVDFDDGTYGVRLGNSFYRVDNDLPVTGADRTTPAYAELGAENSMWVAIAEKAFAHYRTGANSYASIEGGWSVEVNRAFGTTSPGDGRSAATAAPPPWPTTSTAAGTATDAVTIGFAGGSIAAGAPLINGHMYTVHERHPQLVGRRDQHHAPQPVGRRRGRATTATERRIGDGHAGPVVRLDRPGQLGQRVRPGSPDPGCQSCPGAWGGGGPIGPPPPPPFPSIAPSTQRPYLLHRRRHSGRGSP